MHGGKTPVGIASPHWQRGRYSRVLPERLRARYHEALADPDLLSMRTDLALIDARLLDVLERADSGDAGRLWQELTEAAVLFKRARALHNNDLMHESIEMILEKIDAGRSDAAVWAEIRGLIDQRRRVSESEQKRLVMARQVLTAEEATALVGAISEAVRRHVTDRVTLQAISDDLRVILNRPQLKDPYDEDI